MNKLFKGCGTAIVTPFKNKEVNLEKFEELLDFQIANNVDAIIVCGTTGEASTLTDEEKISLVTLAVEKCKGKCQVIAGSGSNNTVHSVFLSQKFEQIGVDGLLVVTPYYNKCNEEGLYNHYKKIADSVSIPIILYNVPSRTNVNISPNLVKRLSEISNICGLKEASGNISQITEIMSKINSDEFYIYSGNDDQIYPILSLGGKGVISVASNILPYEISLLCKSFFENNTKRALNLQLKYLPVIKALFTDVNPVLIKHSMNLLNYDVGGLRLPLYESNEINNTLLKNELTKIGLL